MTSPYLLKPLRDWCRKCGKPIEKDANHECPA